MNFVAALAHLMANGLGLWSSEYSKAGWTSPGPGTLVYPDVAGSPMVNYQIDAPSTEYGDPVYSQTLLANEFGASWGKPFSVDYDPPDTAFSHVKLLLEVSSFGVQYDRLAHVYLNDVEIWRPSTSEPRGRESYSNVTKDVSQYLYLFNQPGDISLELNNLVTERLNGTFNVTLTAHYFNVVNKGLGSGPGSNSLSDTHLSPNTWFEHEGLPATVIRSILEPQVAVAPVLRTVPQLPRNTTRAVLQVFASGNGNDEFWYAQSAQEDETGRTGPLRHISVAVNGELGGVISPFYQVYTGGYQPALWSPFVAPNAYDVPAYEIDLTPFLPLFWDANSELEFSVRDLFGELVQHEWIVSAALFAWESEGVEGRGTKHASVEKSHTDKILMSDVEIAKFSQELNVSADLQFNEGPTTHVAWQQTREIDSTIVGGTVITHRSSGKSHTSYAHRNYSRTHHYSIALALGDLGVAVGEDYRVHDAGIEASSSEDLLSRTYGVKYNGSWYIGDEDEYSAEGHPVFVGSGAEKKHSKINGSDVFVSLRDPHRVGTETFKQHAVSRNGSVVTLDAPYDVLSDSAFGDDSDVDHFSALLGSSLNTGAGFPFTRLTEPQLEDRRRIRRKWLKHGI